MGRSHEHAKAPDRQGLVLTALILVASVANLNLAVANTALPDIGKAFNASQTALDLVAVGYSLGLAASVLYLGALGDRYGRKLMLVLGTLIAIPASILAASASSIEILIGARVLGGLAARGRSRCGQDWALRCLRSAHWPRGRC
jgi:MFS family permease